VADLPAAQGRDPWHRLLFRYIQPDRDGDPVELAPEPFWGRVVYQPRWRPAPVAAYFTVTSLYMPSRSCWSMKHTSAYLPLLGKLSSSSLPVSPPLMMFCAM
jgi:hypothetical protein